VPKGDKLKYVLQITFQPYTNNVAKYEVHLHDMRIDKKMSVNRFCCFGNSDLVASEVSGTCDATDPNMIAYHRTVDQLGGSFMGYSVEWIDRRKNEEADALSRLRSTCQPSPPGVFLDILDRPLVLPPKQIELGIPLTPDSALVTVATTTSDWTEPYIAYLKHKVLPEDETEARMI
jgi:hypothetical protein